MQVFNAAINELLLHPDWEFWSRRVLPRYTYAAEDVQPAVEEHMQWYTELKAKRAAAALKAAEEEAAAAAAAVEAAAAEAEAAEPGAQPAAVSEQPQTPPS